jgi:hypothetical protein
MRYVLSITALHDLLHSFQSLLVLAVLFCLMTLGGAVLSVLPATEVTA